jgi:hypothetical protein
MTGVVGLFEMTGVATEHTLVLIAVIPTALVLMVRFLAGGDDRKGVLVDAMLVAVIAWAFWSPEPYVKTGYGLLGYTVFLTGAMLALILRWVSAARARRSGKAKGP